MTGCIADPLEKSQVWETSKKFRYTADISTWAVVGAYLRYVYSICKKLGRQIVGFCSRYQRLGTLSITGWHGAAK
jgi:hypothetical protein